MEEQNQGWSRTAKVTAAIAGIGVIGAGAAMLLGDGADAAEKVAEAAGISTDVTSQAVDNAVETAHANIAPEGGLMTVADTAADVATDAEDATADVAESANTAKEQIGEALSATGEVLQDAAKVATDKAAELADKGGELADKGLAAGGEAVDTIKEEGEKVAKGVGEWVDENPYKAAAAGSAIVGGAAYIKGRSDGARRAEQAGQSYA